MLRAERAHAEVINLLRRLRVSEPLRSAVIQALQSDLPPVQPKPADTTRVREQIRRLKAAYLNGDPDLTDAVYSARLRELEAKLVPTVPEQAPHVFDVSRALRYLDDLPALLEDTDDLGRRAVIRELIETIWLRGTRTQVEVVAWKPTPAYRLVAETVAGVVVENPTLIGMA